MKMGSWCKYLSARLLALGWGREESIGRDSQFARNSGKQYSSPVAETLESRLLLSGSVGIGGGHFVDTGDKVGQAVEMVDRTKPIITLLGDEGVLFEASHDHIYVDAGATCFDLVDGNISHVVEGAGDVVGMAAPGAYTIKYNCENSSGDAADEVLREVYVQDTTCPVVKLNGFQRMKVEAGFPYEDPGASVQDSLDGDLTEELEITVAYTNDDGNTQAIEQPHDPVGSIVIQNPKVGQYHIQYLISSLAFDTSAEKCSPKCGMR